MKTEIILKQSMTTLYEYEYLIHLHHGWLIKFRKLTFQIINISLDIELNKMIYLVEKI